MIQCCILLRLSLNSAMAIPGAGETSAVRPKFAAAVALPEAVTGRVGRHRSTRLCDGTPRRAVSPKPRAHTRRSTAHFQRQRSAPAILYSKWLALRRAEDVVFGETGVLGDPRRGRVPRTEPSLAPFIQHKHHARQCRLGEAVEHITVTAGALRCCGAGRQPHREARPLLQGYR